MSKKKSTKVLLKKKRSCDKKINPFEVRINRKKHEVLGQRRDRSERGYPGISRSRAIEKRKKTLLKEYKERRKTNQLVDRRLNKEDIPEEERDLQRFLLETKRRHERGNIYNLEETEEELTHYGHSLGDHYNDIILSSNDEADIDDTENHFGGFLHKKQSTEQQSDLHKTRKEIMEEIVSKSKQHKYERQMERERIDDLLDTVNNQWKEIHSLLSKSSSTQPTTSQQEDDYDRYVVELANEPKAKATERLKSEEEIAKEKKEKLEKLDEARKKRMTSLSVDTAHRSADDNTKLISDKDRRVMIQYRDGQLVLPDGITSLLATKQQSGPVVSDVSSSESEEIMEGNDEREKEMNEEKEVEEKEEEMNETEEEVEVEEGNEYEEDEIDDLCSDDNIDSTNEEMDDVYNNREINNIPFVFNDVPSNEQELTSLLHNKSPLECSVIIERIIACHHYSISHDNKLIMQLFMSVLLDYCLTVSDVLVLDKLVQYLFELTQINIQNTFQCFQKKLKRCLKQLQKNKFLFSPSLSDLILFKLVAAIFPTSDYKHPIVIPSLHLMTLVLINDKLLHNISGVCIGLCTCKIILEYISISKRYVPELANYLTSILDCFSSENVIKLSLPFTDNLKKSLSLFTFSSEDNITLLSPVQLLSYSDDLPSNQVKVSLFKLTLQLIELMSQYWQSLSSYDVIFNPILNILNKYNNVPPQSLNDLVQSIKKSLETNVSRPKPVLWILRRKPKSIAFYEPQFDEDYQPGRKKARDKTLAERMKLKHKYKRELKGAIREVRKDNKFLAKEKLQEQLAKDKERMKKVKQIEGWLQEQQHDMKKEKLQKRK